jgi:hypothetical protein
MRALLFSKSRMLREPLEMMMRRLGYRVMATDDLPDAIAISRLKPPFCVVAVLEPDDRFEALEYFSTLPVVVLVRDQDSLIRLEHMRLPKSHALLRPVRVAHLRTAFRTIHGTTPSGFLVPQTQH